ncbi:MAG: acetyltransferase [Microbacteriaceae bacterium]|nr:acetyltransferase [Microbacteriaceae bacterium]
MNSRVTEFWRATMHSAESVPLGVRLRVSITPDLREDRRLMILDVVGGAVEVVMTPAVADRLTLDPDDVAGSVAAAGIALHGADFVYYFPEDARPAVDPSVRVLTEADADAFAAFVAANTEQDLDDAWVELDHWLVAGAFEGDRLASAASMYPWEGSTLADLGVLTAPEFRGRGYGRRVVRGISALALERGHEPQYRCQVDNAASIALADAAGFTRFAAWDLIAQ